MQVTGYVNTTVSEEKKPTKHYIELVLALDCVSSIFMCFQPDCVHFCS